MTTSNRKRWTMIQEVGKSAIFTRGEAFKVWTRGQKIRNGNTYETLTEARNELMRVVAIKV